MTEAWLTQLELPAGQDAVPPLFPSPFDELAPSALARHAAAAFQAELAGGLLPPAVYASLQAPEGGKMFGVLVVQRGDGSLGYLRAFSGMLAGAWALPGFVPPLFDAAARARVELPGEEAVKALLARATAFERSVPLMTLRAEYASLQSRHAATRAALRERHERRRAARHAERALLKAGLEAPAEGTDAPCVRTLRLRALEQESRGDKAERRSVEAGLMEEARALDRGLQRLERRARALHRLRRLFCRALMREIQRSYWLVNGRGERRNLLDCFAPGAPPSGAGDCAAPKLLGFAHAHDLRPVALAEFWWGAPPKGGGRVHGAFYPACREKCGPLLPFLLEGLPVAPTRRFEPPESQALDLRVVYEDEWLVVVDKPAGLLSVPAREARFEDSVLQRLRRRHPEARGALLAHRLDLDTSGLLVAALQPKVHAGLQRQFLSREVHKRYTAWLDGVVRGEEGLIDLPLRVNLEDRPRQLVDFEHGKAALTRWKVQERRGGCTRVALHPLTGRTHQLRVHTAHPLGLGAPIHGDRLYGHPAQRLHLHAEALSFVHPVTGRRLAFEVPAPFVAPSPGPDVSQAQAGGPRSRL